MTTIEDKAKVMTEGRLGRQEGACALKSHTALPPEWRGACGPILLVDVSPVSYIAAFRNGRKASGKNDAALAVEIGLAAGKYIRDIVADVKPSAAVLVFDSPVPTLRSGLLAGYKANREERKEGYDEEKRRINGARLEAVKNLYANPPAGLNVMRKEGYESDDLIAAFVHALRLLPTGERMIAKSRIMIATNDVDLCQLLDFDSVDILDVGKRAYVTAKSFAERMGYPPALIPAVKSIAGDPSDNIPGVRDVGEVTATKFLTGGVLTQREYGLIEADWEDVETFYDLVKLPFPGCTLEGLKFDASKKPGECVADEDIMPF